MKIQVYTLLVLTTIFVLASCKKDSNEVVENDMAVYDDTPYELSFGILPPPPIPGDNIPTVEGVKLGRMLFYEKRLSKNNIQACADCHLQIDGFSDINQFSTGVEGLQGGRQAMAVMNMAWHDEGFFWDGRASTLRDQALRPIQDPLEMNETLENVIAKLSADIEYKNQFMRAFGTNQISSDRIALALEQFMFTLISANSRYDRYLTGQETLNPSELRGKDLFFSEFDPFGTERGAECFHCHGGPDFSNHAYMNNGLDSDENFTDEGRFAVTNDPFDMAAFKVPSLRNIAVTAPYMHDGRFNTLEEVIEHYNTGVVASSSVHPLLQFNLDPGLGLTQEEINDLVAFLHTLTDEEFLTNEAFSDPN